MATISEIQAMLQHAFQNAEKIEVTNPESDGKHFHITVKSAKFNDLTLVKQHQLIYRLFKDQLDTNEIHALKLTTITTKS